MDAVEAAQLGDGVWVVVDAQVDQAVVVAAVAAAGRDDRDRRRLASAAVAAGCVACGQREQQPVGEVAAARLVGLGHRVDDVRPREDVALRGVAGAGAAARPRHAALARCASRRGRARRRCRPGGRRGPSAASSASSASRALAPSRICASPSGAVERVGERLRSRSRRRRPGATARPRRRPGTSMRPRLPAAPPARSQATMEKVTRRPARPRPAAPRARSRSTPMRASSSRSAAGVPGQQPERAVVPGDDLGRGRRRRAA